MSMTTNRQALRQLAEGIGLEKWQARKEPGIGGEHTVIVKGSLVKRSGWSTHRPVADQVVDKKTARFIAAANPATVLALLDELEAAEKRIAELEAREVKLPPNELVTDTWTSPGDGWEVFDAQKVIDSIRSAGVRIAAGITVKGE